MRVFITGINGLIGRHTAKALEKSGNSVFGISQRESIKPNIIQCDFFDSQKLFSILEKVNPDIILFYGWSWIVSEKLLAYGLKKYKSLKK